MYHLEHSYQSHVIFIPKVLLSNSNNTDQAYIINIDTPGKPHQSLPCNIITKWQTILGLSPKDNCTDQKALHPRTPSYRSLPLVPPLSGMPFQDHFPVIPYCLNGPCFLGDLNTAYDGHSPCLIVPSEQPAI